MSQNQNKKIHLQKVNKQAKAWKHLSGKEAILKNIRKALVHSTDIPYPAIEKTEFSFHTPKEDLAVLFAEKFSSLLGKFSFCDSEEDLVQQISELVETKNWEEVYCTDENIKSALSSLASNHFLIKSSKMLMYLSPFVKYWWQELVLWS